MDRDDRLPEGTLVIIPSDAPPLLLFGGYYPYCDEDWLDPRDSFEAYLGHERDRLPAILDEWLRLKGGARSEDDFRDFGIRRLDLPWVEPPEGTSFRRWAEWAESRLVEALERPETLPPLGYLPFSPRLRRAGEFRDDTARQLLVQELVLVHEDRVRRWLEDPDAGLRLHLSGDVGWRVGDALVVQGQHEEVLRRRPTTRGSVTLKRTDARGRPDLHAAAAAPVDPREPAGAEEVRARWPQLEQVLGGYFGQHGARWQYPWGVQRALLVDDQPAFLAVVQDQLAELLALADDDLDVALRALGCYVEPPDPRGWLERMRWRMGAFDWR